MDSIGFIWSLVTGILGWMWWCVRFLYTTFPFSLIMTIVTIGVAFAAYSEYAKAGGGLKGLAIGCRYAITNFPRIAYETIRWTLRIALVDLPRIFGKDLTSALPPFLQKWLGSSPSEVRVVEKVVHVGAARPSFRSRMRKRARHFLVDAILVSAAWNYATVYAWLSALMSR